MVVTVPPFRRKFTVYSRTKDVFFHFSLLLFKKPPSKVVAYHLKALFLHFFIKKPHPGNYENSLKIFPNSCQDQD